MSSHPLLTHKKKVLAYITRGSQLLVFRHTQFPEAGLQVPAGTVEENESPEKAVLRETEEETGQKDFRILAYLGESFWKYEIDGKHFTEKRYFYHLLPPEGLPETWLAYEWSPSDGSPAPIEFEYFWIETQEADGKLSGQQDEFLHIFNKNNT